MTANPTEICILTTKDFTILEVMRDRCDAGSPLAPILKKKLETALVVFRDDVPENVATLSSRVTFTVDGSEADTRILSHDAMSSSVGTFQPISTARGLALLGMAEGEDFHLVDRNGREERIVLEKVQYQPEAARRARESVVAQADAAHRKSALRLIRGAFYDQPAVAPAGTSGGDDPGPSAA
ncbi:nucleoside-diphosphate kinase [Mesorhizobium marinum]|uniref:nucleoside-diphosphate kinase n=1 Tax=Mesorhizobium marinum TaxID=3228790 RepID=UPI00346531D2